MINLDIFFQDQNKKKQVKILTCGSVDDGKSTLLGRLLFDSQNIFIDQMDQAKSVEEIIIELIKSKNSEREGRAIDKDQIGSMEKKKQEGYF